MIGLAKASTLWMVLKKHRIGSFDIENENHMRKIILDHRKLSKPRGIAVHPIHGYLFYSDWDDQNPHIGRTNMDGTEPM